MNDFQQSEKATLATPAAVMLQATNIHRHFGQLHVLKGVNLDEEAARLIQFQQSYQAAAKLLQTAQTLFDALLSSVSR